MIRSVFSRFWLGAVIWMLVLLFHPGKAASQEFGDLSFVDIHGYVDLTYFDFGYDGDPVLPFTDGGGIPSFDNNHTVLFFGANISENLRFTSEFHYEHSIEEPELPQAAIVWRLADPVVLTFGRFWFPFGTLGHDKIYQPTNLLVSYPYTVGQALPFHHADNGVKLSGDVPFVNYQVAIVNGFAGLDEEGGNVLRDLAQDNNQNKRVVGRIIVTPIPILTVAGSYTWGEWDDNNNASISLWGADAELKAGPVEIKGEYIGGKLENPDDAVATVAGELRCNSAATDPRCTGASPPALSDNMGPIAEGDSNRTSYFIQAAYEFLKEQAGVNSATAVVRYDVFDRDQAGDVGNRSRFTFGLNVSPVPHFHLKGEYQLVSEDEPDLKNNGVMGQAVVDF